MKSFIQRGCRPDVMTMKPTVASDRKRLVTSKIHDLAINVRSALQWQQVECLVALKNHRQADMI